MQLESCVHNLKFVHKFASHIKFGVQLKFNTTCESFIQKVKSCNKVLKIAVSNLKVGWIFGFLALMVPDIDDISLISVQTYIHVPKPQYNYM